METGIEWLLDWSTTSTQWTMPTNMCIQSHHALCLRPSMYESAGVWATLAIVHGQQNGRMEPTSRTHTGIRGARRLGFLEWVSRVYTPNSVHKLTTRTLAGTSRGTLYWNQCVALRLYCIVVLYLCPCASMWRGLFGAHRGYVYILIER